MTLVEWVGLGIAVLLCVLFWKVGQLQHDRRKRQERREKLLAWEREQRSHWRSW
jgi:hypothetical protein